MSRDILIALGGGLASALLYVIPLFLLLTPMPLFFAGLSLGAVSSAIAAATAVVLISFYDVIKAITYAAVFAGPCLLVVRYALLSRTTDDGDTEWYPPGLLLCWVTGYAALGIIVVTLLFSGYEGGLRGLIDDLIDGERAHLAQYYAEQSVRTEITTFTETYAPIAPGIIAIIFIVITVAGGVIVQALLVRHGRNIRPTPEFTALVVPGWVTYALAGTVVAANIGSGGISYIGQNLALVLAMPYFFVGLSVIHAFARRSPYSLIILVLFYGLLIFRIEYMMLLVSLFGLLETWMNLRQRMAGRGTV